MKYIVSNKVMGIINFKNKTISDFIIVENIDNELRNLADLGLVKIEKYIEKEKSLDEFENKKHRR
jgi:hypothetical protein